MQEKTGVSKGKVGTGQDAEICQASKWDSSSERVEARYGQDMERKEVSEGHSLWLGHRKGESKCSASVSR